MTGGGLATVRFSRYSRTIIQSKILHNYGYCEKVIFRDSVITITVITNSRLERTKMITLQHKSSRYGYNEQKYEWFRDVRYNRLRMYAGLYLVKQFTHANQLWPSIGILQTIFDPPLGLC